MHYEPFATPSELGPGHPPLTMPRIAVEHKTKAAWHFERVKLCNWKVCSNFTRGWCGFSFSTFGFVSVQSGSCRSEDSRRRPRIQRPLLPDGVPERINASHLPVVQ